MTTRPVPDIIMNIILFYILSVIILASALLILFGRNIIYSVYLLVLAFVGIAGIYIINNAEFIAVTQIIIYAGGILILLVFGVMLTNRVSGDKVLTGSSNMLAALMLCAILFIVLLTAVLQVQFPENPNPHPVDSGGITGIQGLGIQLMTDFILPFELAGILLLVALIGASFLAGKKTESEENDTR